MSNRMWGGRFASGPAEIMEEIGWQTRLADLSEAQVRTLIEVAFGGFQDAMRAIAQGSAETRGDAEIPF